MRSVLSWITGRSLRSDEADAEQLGPATAVPALGLDALASATYGPEAALTVLLAAGSRGAGVIVPITLAIVVVLALVVVSYLQTLSEYPDGGGSYTVAKENLGPAWGVLAATALCTDYVLNVAVAIAAGVGAIVSVSPALLPHTLGLCLAILVLLTMVNLRGLRTAGTIFTAPTYAFIGSLAIMIVAGLFGQPRLSAPSPQAAATALTAWLVVRAFASGCTALTGVEAVSNAVPVFREPTVRHAKQTLIAIAIALAALLCGIAWLARDLRLVATAPGQPGYQSVVSQLATAVFGRGVMYGITMAAVLAVLCLSANTSFADFPRVCRLLADDHYLPDTFGRRGARLVYSAGIVVLAVLAAGLLVAFHGVTDALIPLFAVGAFSAFTLSQAGMVAHWRSRRTSKIHSALSFVGACATAATLGVIIVAKFLDGAWLTVLVIPAGYGFLRYSGRLQRRMGGALAPSEPLNLDDVRAPVAVVPVEHVNRAVLKAVRFAVSFCDVIYGVHVVADEHDAPDVVASDWEALVAGPARKAGLPVPRLHRIRSPYRRVVQPLLDAVHQIAEMHPARTIAVVIPERIEPHWYQMWLHSQRATLIKIALLMRGGPHVAVVNTPWYVTDSSEQGAAEAAAPQPARPRSAKT
jgi:amino acid transporter